MKKNENLPPTHPDPKELKVNLDKDNFTFVGSGTDTWAVDVPSDWITQMLDHYDKLDNKNLNVF